MRAALGAALALLAAPVQALACSVCFGGAGSDLRRGFYWGIMLLLLLPVLLAAAIGTKIFLAVRKKAHETGSQPYA